MKFLKKLTLLILAVIFSVFIVACNDSENNDNQNNNNIPENPKWEFDGKLQTTYNFSHATLMLNNKETKLNDEIYIKENFDLTFLDNGNGFMTFRGLEYAINYNFSGVENFTLTRLFEKSNNLEFSLSQEVYNATITEDYLKIYVNNSPRAYYFVPADSKTASDYKFNYGFFAENGAVYTNFISNKYNYFEVKFLNDHTAKYTYYKLSGGVFSDTVYNGVGYLTNEQDNYVLRCDYKEGNSVSNVSIYFDKKGQIISKDIYKKV